MGVAVDPASGSNRRVYTCFLSNRGGAPDVRVVRWRMNDGRHRPHRPRRHRHRDPRELGAPLRVPARGSVPTGGSGSAPATPPAPTVPQSPTSLGGKVLRVDTNGQRRAGQRAGPVRPAHLHLRPPQRAGHRVQPRRQGLLHRARHRTATTRSTGSSPAANYGWDPRPLVGADVLRRVPADDRHHPASGRPGAVWSSGTPPSRPSGGDFLRGAEWKGWDGALAMAVLKDQQLRVLRFDTNGTRWTPSGCASPTGVGLRGGRDAPLQRAPLPRHRRRPRQHPPSDPRLTGEPSRDMIAVRLRLVARHEAPATRPKSRSRPRSSSGHGDDDLLDAMSTI